MPDALEATAHVLLIDGPLQGAHTTVLDGASLTVGTEFAVPAWDLAGETERYTVTRVFNVRCAEHGVVHRKVIAKHKPRVTV